MSATQKHEREALRAIRAMHTDMEADIEPVSGGKGHKLLVATLRGVTVKVTVSCSPCDADLCVRQVRSNTARAFRDRGITIHT